jgi:hypothetical protein
MIGLHFWRKFPICTRGVLLERFDKPVEGEPPVVQVVKLLIEGLRGEVGI